MTDDLLNRSHLDSDSSSSSDNDDAAFTHYQHQRTLHHQRRQEAREHLTKHAAAQLNIPEFTLDRLPSVASFRSAGGSSGSAASRGASLLRRASVPDDELFGGGGDFSGGEVSASSVLRISSLPPVFRLVTWLFQLGECGAECTVEECVEYVRGLRVKYREDLAVHLVSEDALHEDDPLAAGADDAAAAAAAAASSPPKARSPSSKRQLAMSFSQHNPLTQNEESPWFKHFQNQVKLDEIRRDVTRTHQDDLYFSSQEAHQLLERVLLVWSLAHGGELSYRQGMNELLAVILFALRGDHQAKLDEVVPPDYPRELVDLVSEEHLEADAYSLLTLLISRLRPWFGAADESHHVLEEDPDDYFSASARRLDSISEEPQAHVQPLYKHFRVIQRGLLKRADPQLFECFEREEILPQLFLLRWLRVLFSREFTLHQTAAIWDAIFAVDGRSLAFADYFALAMIVHMRFDLLLADEGCVIGKLMRYPRVEDIGQLVQLAQMLRERPKDAVRVFILVWEAQRAAEQPPKPEPKKPRRRSFLHKLFGRNGADPDQTSDPGDLDRAPNFSALRRSSMTPPPRSSFSVSAANTSNNSTVAAYRASLIHPPVANSLLDFATHGRVKQGYLVKRGAGSSRLGRMSLKRRWFILRDAELTYHKNPDSKKPIKNRRINMRGRTVTITDRVKFAFQIATKNPKDRVYELYADDEHDLMAWVGSLRQAAAGDDDEG